MIEIRVQENPPVRERQHRVGVTGVKKRQPNIERRISLAAAEEAMDRKIKRSACGVGSEVENLSVHLADGRSRDVVISKGWSIESRVDGSRPGQSDQVPGEGTALDS